MTQHLFVLKCFNNDYYIHFSRDINQSIRKFAPYIPIPLECVWQFECTNYSQFHTWISLKYASNRIKGHWFRFTPVEFVDVITTLDANKNRYHDPTFFHTTETIFNNGLKI